MLGQHKGLPFYTVGQRRGLGIAAPEALYVLEIDVVRNALVVGTAAELGRTNLTAGDVSYVSGEAPREPLRVTAKIRYNAREAPALLTPLSDDRAALRFDHPLRDITPGQGAAFYRGQELLGGGIIEC
jgi:tRNA-specific 2-thiouridylase